MKYLLLLSCLAVVVYGGFPTGIVKQINARLRTHAEECKIEIRTSDDDVAPLLTRQPPTTPKGKCFVACMHKKIGFQDVSGNFDKAAIHALLENLKPLDADLYGKMLKITDTCLAKVTESADECEAAADWFNCMERDKIAAGIPFPINIGLQFPPHSL